MLAAANRAAAGSGMPPLAVGAAAPPVPQPPSSPPLHGSWDPPLAPFHPEFSARRPPRPIAPAAKSSTEGMSSSASSDPASAAPAASKNEGREGEGAALPPGFLLPPSPAAGSAAGMPSSWLYALRSDTTLPPPKPWNDEPKADENAPPPPRAPPAAPVPWCTEGPKRDGKPDEVGGSASPSSTRSAPELPLHCPSRLPPARPPPPAAPPPM
mmetsp:Transcript_69196/g.218907  ORF Transcript_69196/g.218907 Transcript_69196/m.218907 type:complete len:212 (+) Transcript_69196:163-798(+)